MKKAFVFLLVFVISVVGIAIWVVRGDTFKKPGINYVGTNNSSEGQTVLLVSSDIPGYSLNITDEEYFWNTLNSWGVLTKPKTILETHVAYGDPVKGIEVRLTNTEQEYLKAAFGSAENPKIEYSAGVKVDYERNFLIIYLHFTPEYLSTMPLDFASQVASRSMFARFYGMVNEVDKGQDMYAAEKLNSVLKIEKI